MRVMWRKMPGAIGFIIYREHDVELARRHGEMQWVRRIQQALDADRFQLYAQIKRPTP